MKVKNHLFIGFLVGVGISGVHFHRFIMPTHTQVVLISAVMVGSILPDIDFTIKGFKKQSFKERTMLSHRGITHHLLFPVIIFLCSLFYTGYLKVMLYGMSIGISVHIFLDMFSPLGIPAPYSLKYQKRIAIPLYRTGSLSELVFIITLILLMAVLFELSHAYTYI